MKTDRRSLSSASALATALLFGQACAQDTGLGNPQGTDLQWSIPQSQIQDGGPGKDGIPALTNPEIVTPGTGETSYLKGEDRVFFRNRDGQAAMAYSPVLGEDGLAFPVVDGRILDDQTGSVWTVDGMEDPDSACHLPGLPPMRPGSVSHGRPEGLLLRVAFGDWRSRAEWSSSPLREEVILSSPRRVRCHTIGTPGVEDGYPRGINRRNS